MNLKRQVPIALVSILVPILFIGSSNSLAAQYRHADVEAAIQQLSSKDESERGSACNKLSEMGPEGKDAVPGLINVLQTDAVASVRGEAAKALGNIGPDAESAVPALIAFLKSADGGYERTYAATAIGEVGKMPQEAVPALVEALQRDNEPVVRHLAARALGDFGADARSSIPSLVESIKAGDVEMREAAAYGLAKIPASASDVPLLNELLSDEIDSARIAAAKSLGGAGSEAAGCIPKLKNLLADKNMEVREAASQALKEIRGKHRG